MVLGKLDSHLQRMKMDHSLTPYTRLKSRWMKDLNVRQESIKILEGNIGRNLFDLGGSNFLLVMSSKARETKPKMNYWDFIKRKSFCTAKETVKQNKTKMYYWHFIKIKSFRTAKETINKTKRQPME